MKTTLSLVALSLLLALGCDGDPPETDAGPGETDAGPMMMMRDAGPPMMRPDAGPPDMMANTRLEAASDRIRTVTCGCDMMPFASAMECEDFNQLAESDTCTANAFDMHFSGVGGFFTCRASVLEEQATCYEAASCNEMALAACRQTAESAGMACPQVAMADVTAYQATLDMCVSTMVVGTGGMCPDDMGAVSTTGMSVFMGSTLGAASDLDAPMGCITAMGGGGSADRAFRWTAPAAGDFVFDTNGSSFDTVLYVLNGCDAAMSLGCNDDVMMGDLRSSVTATLTMDQEVLVVVEGFGARNAGDFVVNINPAP